MYISGTLLFYNVYFLLNTTAEHAILIESLVLIHTFMCSIPDQIHNYIDIHVHDHNLHNENTFICIHYPQPDSSLEHLVQSFKHKLISHDSFTFSVEWPVPRRSIRRSIPGCSTLCCPPMFTQHEEALAPHTIHISRTAHYYMCQYVSVGRCTPNKAGSIQYTIR